MKISPAEENAMSLFAVHAIQAESWSYFMKGKVQQEFKFRLENFLAASKMLRKYLEKENVIDVTDDLGESINKIFEVIRDSKDGQAQRDMIVLLSEYAEGKLKLIHESDIVQQSTGT